MKASEITNERLGMILSGYECTTRETKALAQAELDRRKVEATIIKGITNDRLETLFLHGHQAHPHEVAVMAGELIEHRRCNGVHDKSCVKTSKAKTPVEVKYWRGKTSNWLLKTETNSDGEYRGVEYYCNGEKRDIGLECPYWYCENSDTEITADEYIAATKPIIGEACEHGVPIANECVACGRLAAKKPPLMVDCPPVVDEVRPAVKCDCVTGTSLKACSAASRNWLCTRPNGHSGDHVACGTDEHNMFSWPQETTKPAAPVVEPEKSCKSCGDTACRLPDHGWNLCRSWIPKPAAPVAEPWIKTCSIDSGAIRQLQRRLEAVEKAGKI